MITDQLLKLQHLADSALPIGAAAHSFGLESLVDADLLRVETLEAFLLGFLEETGALEASYCAASCGIRNVDEWMALNAQLGARKSARESREGSAAMGRRFLHLAAAMSRGPLLEQACQEAEGEIHLANAFGFVAGTLGIEPELASAAFLQQSITTLISCCQRLLPLGQTRAHQIVWNLKAAILETARSIVPAREVYCFSPLVEIVSARHPTLSTRLFVS